MSASPSHTLDSRMYADSFGNAEMRAIFNEASLQQRRLDVEAALAQTEAELGIIPAEAASAIVAHARLGDVDLERIVAHYKQTQNDVVALVRALGERLDSASREYVHFGATSQDIHITSLALLLRDALDWFDRELARLERTVVDLAERERDTIMAGRTHGQYATPITFGYKVAGWAYAVYEHHVRLRELRPRLLLGSLKGAVGTHASFQGMGPRVEEGVMARLGLGIPPINVQPGEERYVELLNWLSLVATTVGRVAQEIRSLHRSEVSELREPFEEGLQVGSSTMPHKRNPEWAETAQGTVYVVQAHAIGMSRVLQENERDATRNGPEQLLIGEACILTANLLAGMQRVLSRLEVDREQMRRNLDLMYGLINSEAVMFALAKKTGKKETAHHVVYEASNRAFNERRPFREVLREYPWVVESLSDQELERALDPANHVGSCREQIDRVCTVVKGVAAGV